MSSPGSERGNKVLGTLTLIGVQHLEKEEPRLRREIEVRCSVPERTMLSGAGLTLESVDRALVPASVAITVATWLETAH